MELKGKFKKKKKQFETETHLFAFENFFELSFDTLDRDVSHGWGSSAGLAPASKVGPGGLSPGVEG